MKRLKVYFCFNSLLDENLDEDSEFMFVNPEIECPLYAYSECISDILDGFYEQSCSFKLFTSDCIYLSELYKQAITRLTFGKDICFFKVEEGYAKDAVMIKDEDEFKKILKNQITLITEKAVDFDEYL